MPTRTAKSRGPGTPTLVSSLKGDSREATVARKPGTPGRARISRKPLRRECRHVRRTCRDLRACCLPFCTQGCGCVSASGIPCALFLSRVDDDVELGRKSRRGNALSRLLRCHAPRKRGIQYSRGVSAQALPPLEYWVARSRRATTPSSCLKFESEERRRRPYSAISTGRCAGPASWRSSMVIMQSMAQVIIAAAAPNT